MHYDGLSLAAWLGIAAGAITLAGVLVAAWSAWISVSNERKRTQPIVVAHEEHGRRFTEDGRYFAVGGYITNEAAGHAFNVRFGVELDGVRYPQKLRADDPDSGNVQRILRPGERRPKGGSWPILIPQLSLLGAEGDSDPGRVYWARYENARNQTWETRNPWDRSARLNIRRVRWVRLRERKEQQRRAEANERGAAWERKALAELRAGMTSEEKQGTEAGSESS
jgi:hypothetical protein